MDPTVLFIKFSKNLNSIWFSLEPNRIGSHPDLLLPMLKYFLKISAKLYFRAPWNYRQRRNGFIFQLLLRSVWMSVGKFRIRYRFQLGTTRISTIITFDLRYIISIRRIMSNLIKITVIEWNYELKESVPYYKIIWHHLPVFVE